MKFEVNPIIKHDKTEGVWGKGNMLEPCDHSVIEQK